jgi:hypothetical protein
MATHLLSCPKASVEAKKFAQKYVDDRETESTNSGPPPLKQTRVTGFYDTTPDELKNEIDNAVADFFFANGISFRVADDFYFRRLVDMLRPSYTPPCSSRLRTTLLSAAAEKAEEHTVQKIREAQYVSVLCDGWSNVRRERVINIVVCTPRPYIWSTVQLGAETCDANKVAAVILENVGQIERRCNIPPASDSSPMALSPGEVQSENNVEEKEGAVSTEWQRGMDVTVKVVGLVTDNAADMRAAWKKITERRSFMICVGCFAHGMNLFLCDVAKDPGFKQLFDKFLEVVTIVKSSPKKSARLKELQEQEYGKTISLHTPVVLSTS